MCSPLETPLAYDFWSAIWTLGSALGRSVYIPRPHSHIHMNWYVMLVSESGITRKSTSVRMARDIISDTLGVMHLVEGRATPEHLFDRLVQMPHIAIAVSELVTFLGRESYVVELPALLTDLYDCPKQRSIGTISRGQRVIQDAYVTFLSASTPSWLIGAVNPSVIEGGFTSRCIFIREERPKQKVPWPAQGAPVQHHGDLLLSTVQRAQTVRTIELLPAAMRRYQTWYKSRDTVTDVPFLASFLSREDAHVLRLAACLCINDGVLAIDRRHIDFALKAITAAKASALQIFSGKGTVVRMAQGIDKITRLLAEAGGVGVPHTPMYTAVRHYLSADDFNIILSYMHELGMLQIAMEGRSSERSGGRRPKRYFRTDATMRRDKMNALREAVLA